MKFGSVADAFSRFKRERDLHSLGDNILTKTYAFQTLKIPSKIISWSFIYFTVLLLIILS